MVTRVSALVWRYGERALIALLAVVLSAAAPTTQPVTVRWDAKASWGACVDRSALEVGIEQAIGRAVFTSSDSADVVLELRVDGERSATLRMSDVQGRSLGRRSLAAADCAELNQALALALSLMLDFSREELVQRQSEAPAADTLPPAEAMSPARSAASDETKPVQPEQVQPEQVQPGEDESLAPAESSTAAASKWRLALLGRASAGLAPRPVMAAKVALGRAVKGLPYFELDAAYTFRQRFARSGGSVELSAMELGASACPLTFGDGATTALVCARASAARAATQGRGYAADQSASAWLAQLGGGLHLVHSFGPFNGQARALLAVPVSGYHVTVSDGETRRQLFANAPLVASLSLGVGLDFP